MKTTEELRALYDDAHNALQEAIDNKSRLRLSIPADPEHDHDLRIARALNELPRAAEKLEEATYAADEFAKQIAVLRNIVREMVQAYADQQCGWHDAVSYHGHTDCSRKGVGAAGLAFENRLTEVLTLVDFEKPEHFESKGRSNG